MVIDGWYLCPVCFKRINRIPLDSVVYNTPFYCRKCKMEWYPTIFEGRELDIDEPFPTEDIKDN